MNHLDEATWERLAMHELDPGARATALAHITACADCCRMWTGLVALERGAREFDPAVPQARTPASVAPSRRRWYAAGAVAAVAAAAVALVVLRPSGDEGMVITRGSEAALELEGPRGAVLQPVRFSWSSVAGADRYRLELFDRDGTPLWSSIVTTSPHDVPVRSDLGRARFARVTALSGTRTIVMSPLATISVER